MIKHMKRVITSKTGPHGLAYDFIFFVVFEKFDIPLEKGVSATRHDMFILSTLINCDCVSEKSLGKKCPNLIIQTFMDLKAT